MKKILVCLFMTLALFSVSCKSKKEQAPVTPVKPTMPKTPAQKKAEAEDKLAAATVDLTAPIEPTIKYDEPFTFKPEDKPVAYPDITAMELVSRFRNGWNLGNTFDSEVRGLAGEMGWGMPETTEEMIKGLADSGIKSIRIPVSWKWHIIDDQYTIDPNWMERVMEVVDWAIKYDMYVILNSHHDNHPNNTLMANGDGYYPSRKNVQESINFLVNTWEQICAVFNNNYDEHLMFEVLNEPRLRGTGVEWNFDQNNALSKEGAECLNIYTQKIVDTIRASGGNNAKRLIGIPGHAASTGAVFSNLFKLPDDPANMLAVSVHMYAPYNFAMASPGETEFTEAHKKELVNTFNSLNNKFVSKGIPVYIGEYGATNKNNLDQKVEWFKFFNTGALKYNMPCFLWDNQQFAVTSTDAKRFEEKYGFYNRLQQKWFEPEILEAIVESTK